jgi:hypothetical protein
VTVEDRRRLLRTGFVATSTTALLAWSIGVSPTRSLLLGVAALAVVPLLSTPVDPPVTLPWVAVRRGHGARRDVSRLAWGMTRRRVDPRVVRRLSASARTRLANLGIDLDVPGHAAKAKSALGERAYSVLVVGDPNSIRQRDLLELVGAVERLGDRSLWS